MIDDMLGDKTFAELGMRMLRASQRPILPDTRDYILSVPGRNGAFDYGVDLSQRVFNLQCAFKDVQTPYRLQQAVRTLAAHLLDEYGKPKTLQLRFKAESDKYYNVRYAGNLPIDRIAGFGTFTLPLIAYDPYSYQLETSDQITWDSEIYMDNDILTFDDVFSFTVTGTTTLNVNNFGLTSVAPLIQIDGSFTTLSITANGKTLNYNEAFNGSTLDIDCDKMTVKYGLVNKLGKSSGDFPILISGNNSIQVNGTGLNCSVSFVFQARYL